MASLGVIKANDQVDSVQDAIWRLRDPAGKTCFKYAALSIIPSCSQARALKANNESMSLSYVIFVHEKPVKHHFAKP
jgi:hypothetical protein